MADYNRQAVLQKPSRFVTECPPALFEIWDLEEEIAGPAPMRSPLEVRREFIN
jgi:hypothetical protein